MTQTSSYQDWLDFYTQWQQSPWYADMLRERQQASRTEADRYGDTQKYQKATLKQQKAKIDNDYKIAKMNARTAQESNAIDRWYKQQSIELAKVQLLAGMKGPANALQYERVASGMGLRDPNAVPASVTAAFNGTRLPQQNAFSGAPIAAQNGEVAQMAARLGGAGDSTNPVGSVTPDIGAGTYANTLNLVKQIAARGPHKLASGVYESMTGYQQQIFDSGLSEAGYDPTDWHDRRVRSYAFQGNPAAAV